MPERKPRFVDPSAVLRAPAFEVVRREGTDYLRFKVCPCCGEPARAKKTALMEFDHPAIARPVGYMLDERCARRIAGKGPQASEASNKVALAILGAVRELNRAAGNPDPMVIEVDDPSTFARGPGRAQ